MDPRLLAQLCEIVESGSLRRAAERLNVTQPTLSRNIQFLEDRVGAPVLRRLRHGVEPTRLGQRLVERGQEIISQCELAGAMIEQWHMGLEEEIVVGTGAMIAASIMKGFFAENLDAGLSYAIHSLTLPPERLIYRVDDGELDAAIGPIAMKRQYPNLHQSVLFSDQPVVFAGPKSPLSELKETIDLESLQVQTWVSAGSPATRTYVHDILIGHGIENWHTPFHFSGDVSVAMHLVANTKALAILPRFQTRLNAGGEGLTELKLPFEIPPRSYALWTRDGDRDRPTFLDFEKRLRRYVQSLEIRGARQNEQLAGPREVP